MMKDEEFEELKRLVREEERRRAAIKEKQDYAKELRKGFGLQPYNGWVCNMQITIFQHGTMTTGNDGNGPIRDFHKEVELNDQACKLLFDGFDQAANLFEAEVKELEEQDNAR